MNVETFREYCIAKPGTTEDSPFGPEHIVFKVSGKMFALLAFEEVPPTANLKCDPDLALELRDRYEQVRPGYHMNKKHWNTVEIAGGIPEHELRTMIDHSYELVVRSLTKSARTALSL
jgi:predicted DNA-binding protein (MmcQ/YjbR family)